MTNRYRKDENYEERNSITSPVGLHGELIIMATVVLYKKNSETSNNYKEIDAEMSIVTSLEDEIKTNTVWCGTFNLIWNDLKNDLVKQDITFKNQSKLVDNLNKGTFNESYLSEESYYKVYGKPTISLKKEIEKEIKDRFNETSKILERFVWKENESETNRYVLYAMLKKNFEFPTKFTVLDNGEFGNYKNVKFFGINSKTDNVTRKQVEVLYYNSAEDFAIKLITKGNDEVIITKGNMEDSFFNIYQDIMKRKEDYKGSIKFGNSDTLKIPNIKLNIEETFKELENQPFYFADGTEYSIEQTVQTIEFELDEKGGKIKSEAGIMTTLGTTQLKKDEPREFVVDDIFTIFLIENGKELPYFAAKISDISQVQNDVETIK